MMQEFANDKEKWKQHQEQAKKINAIADDIIDLNVSGVTEGFTVTKSLLKKIPGSYLDSMFNGSFQL